MSRFSVVVVAVSCLIGTPVQFLGGQESGRTGLENGSAVDWAMVAKIREEGLQRSHLAEILSYMTDVLGARLTLSEGMTRGQGWAMTEMERIGLVNVQREPFMDYGVSWDNDYTSLHLLQPDYQPMVGFPLAHTPGTQGRQVLDVVIGDVETLRDLERFRGRLAGKAVLATPPAPVDLARYREGVPRRSITTGCIESWRGRFPSPSRSR